MKQRLKKLDERLDIEAPFRTVGKTMSVGDKVYCACIGHDAACPTEFTERRLKAGEQTDVTGTSGRLHFNIRNKTAAHQEKPDFKKLVDAVEIGVEEEIAKMKDYLFQILEDKIPELMMEAITDGNSISLKERFEKLVEDLKYGWEGKVSRFRCPFTLVREEGTIKGPHGEVPIKATLSSGRSGICYFEVGNEYSLPSRSQKDRGATHTFKMAMEIWEAREEIDAWIEQFFKRLNRAK